MKPFNSAVRQHSKSRTVFLTSPWSAHLFRCSGSWQRPHRYWTRHFSTRQLACLSQPLPDV